MWLQKKKIKKNKKIMPFVQALVPPAGGGVAQG
jgi:hypothetical protein